MTSPACLTCAEPLDSAQGTFFCAACRASLRPKSDLDALIAESADLVGREIVRDHDPHSFGSCFACNRGQLERIRVFGEVLAQCSSCHSVWLSAPQLARMRARMGREAARRPLVIASDEERTREVNRVAFDDPLTNRLAYPIALLVGCIGHFLGIGDILWATLEMWFHELGHAVMAWLSGVVAVPLPFFTMVPGESRSVWVILIVLGMIGAIAYESAKRRYWVLVGFAGFLFMMQILMTVVMSSHRAAEWVIFAGQGGAIVLPTLVMLAFYQPIGWRWDFWRYPVVLAAATGFVHAFFIWLNVSRGTGIMPHGSAVGEESEGDMERLVSNYGWTKESLAHTYLIICFTCLVVLTVTYFIYLQRALIRAGTMPASPSGPDRE